MSNVRKQNKKLNNALHKAEEERDRLKKQLADESKKEDKFQKAEKIIDNVSKVGKLSWKATKAAMTYAKQIALAVITYLVVRGCNIEKHGGEPTDPVGRATAATVKTVKAGVKTLENFQTMAENAAKATTPDNEESRNARIQDAQKNAPTSIQRAQGRVAAWIFGTKPEETKTPTQRTDAVTNNLSHVTVTTNAQAAVSSAVKNNQESRNARIQDAQKNAPTSIQRAQGRVAAWIFGVKPEKNNQTTNAVPDVTKSARRKPGRPLTMKELSEMHKYRVT